MKINYDFNDNYSKLYDEAMGVVAVKKALFKNPNKKIRKYTSTLLIYTILMSIIFIIYLILFDTFKAFMIAYFVFILMYVVLCFINFYKMVGMKKEHIGTIEITPDGIIDSENSGFKIEMPYNLIEMVVVTNSAIVFVTKTFFVLFLSNENKDKVLKEVKKHSDVLIIDNAKRDSDTNE